MAGETPKEVKEAIAWLQKLAKTLRIGHPNNEAYAKPLEDAAKDLENGKIEAADEILAQHELYALNDLKRQEYKAWRLGIAEMAGK